MKYLKTFEITNNHVVKVYNNNSDSNYKLFIACYLKGDKQALVGTTLKDGTSNVAIQEKADKMLKQYYKELLESWGDL